MIVVEIFISIIFLIFNFLLILKKKINYIPILIINNVLIDIVIGFLSPGEANTAKILAITRAVINIIAILYITKFLNYRNLKYGKIFIVFSIVLVFIGFNSTLPFKSYPSILKIIIIGFMFGIGYTYMLKTENILGIFKAFFISIILLDFNFIICNIFKIGQTSYSSVVSFYSGGIHIGALNTLAILILSTWFINYFKIKKKKMYYLASFLLTLFLFISFKRLPILLTLLGSIILLFFNESKLKSFKSIVVLSLLILASLPFTLDLFLSQFESRRDYIQVDKFEEESRVQELLFYINEFNTDMSTKRIFFGKELFNSVGNYAGGYFGSREAHTDHGKLLYGGGVVSWLLYMLGFFVLTRYFFKNKKLNKKIKKNIKFLKRLNILFAVITLSLFLSTFSEGLLAVTYRTISLLMLGSIAGYIKINYLHVRNSRNN